MHAIAEIEAQEQQLMIAVGKTTNPIQKKIAEIKFNDNLTMPKSGKRKESNESIFLTLNTS